MHRFYQLISTISSAALLLGLAACNSNAERGDIQFGTTSQPLLSGDVFGSDTLFSAMSAAFAAAPLSSPLVYLGTGSGNDPDEYAEGWDVVIGHTRKVFVEPGDRVRKGQKLALASDDAAPDGCHLHFEKRALEGDLASAKKPRRLLRLKPKE